MLVFFSKYLTFKNLSPRSPLKNAYNYYYSDDSKGANSRHIRLVLGALQV